MTEAPSDAIGLSERLRDVEAAERRVAGDCDCRPEDTANCQYADTCREAATALDALQARVKELEAEKASLFKSYHLAVTSRLEWRNRATSAEQERDEALERLKPLSEVVLPWGNVGSGMVSADAVLAARDLVRRLAAGTEKEGE